MSKPIFMWQLALLFHQNKVLVGWREAKQHQGTNANFQVGKIEAGETPVDACRREVFEEVGIGIQHWHAFDIICHEYDDVIVNLHIFSGRCTRGVIKKIFKCLWISFSRPQLLELNFPNANRAICND